MKKNIKKLNSGYFLIEALFYISLLAVFYVAIVNSIIVMTKSFKQTAIHAEVSQGGVILERISREIKQANDISAISASNLKLDTTDSEGEDKTVEFILSGADIVFMDNEVSAGNLNPENILVDALSFTQITTANGKAVKILLTVHSSHDLLSETSDFYDTVVLRGGY